MNWNAAMPFFRALTDNGLLSIVIPRRSICSILALILWSFTLHRLNSLQIILRLTLAELHSLCCFGGMRTMRSMIRVATSGV
jgi:hypothetical protein